MEAFAVSRSVCWARRSVLTRLAFSRQVRCRTLVFDPVMIVGAAALLASREERSAT
jgi:hypothetical protein